MCEYLYMHNKQYTHIMVTKTFILDSINRDSTSIYTACQKLGLEINIFLQQVCIKLIST